MTDKIAALIAELRPLLGAEGILTGSEVSSRSAGIWRSDTLKAPVLLRPADTQQVAAVLRACHARQQPVVTHGGLTGLVDGATPASAEVVLSTERMTAIEEVNVIDRTMLLQAGVILQTAQERAADEGLMLPLDLGARGSCTLGGNAATNAGGNRVVRYGMTRDTVLGLEAVLADGTIVSSLNAMLKNNAGYDLKQLFIGTEGTLGVITRLVLRLRAQWQSQETALLACASFADVQGLFTHFDRTLGGTLSAFEVMWQTYYELMIAEQTNPPLSPGAPYYVLVEALGEDVTADAARFEQAMAEALDAGLLLDGQLCKSGAERAALWSLRDGVEKTLEFGPALIFDVSLRLSQMDGYVQEVQNRLDKEIAGHRTWVFGHAGDGNLHFVVVPGDRQIARSRVEAAVYEPLQARGGSVSGEHGIGMEKKPWLQLSRSPAEIALMQQLKHALDPRGILNPGRVFDEAYE